MAVFLAPGFLQSTFFVPGGNSPAVGGQLFFYAAGTTTKTSAFTDNTASASHTNPIVLDSGGNIPNGAEIWFTSGQTYKAVFAPANDTDPPTSPYWIRDNLPGINDVTTQEWVAGPTPTFVNASTFTMAADQTGTFTTGRRLRFQVTAATVYGTLANAVFALGSTSAFIRADTSTWLDGGLTAVSYALLSANHPSLPQAFVNAEPLICARISLSSSLPVSTSDITAATALWLLPYKGNVIDIYDGSANWNRFPIAAMSTAVPNTSNTVYDLTAFNSSGIIRLSSTPWTNDTSRAVGLTQQQGVDVLTGALGHLYLATYRTTGVAGQTESSVIKRYVYNAYNQKQLPMVRNETTDSWVAATSAIVRQANNNSSNQLDFVIGLPETPAYAQVVASGRSQATGENMTVSIGLDSTLSQAANSIAHLGGQFNGGQGQMTLAAIFNGHTGIGRHRLTWLESNNGTTATWYGDNGGGLQLSGITGYIFG